jgi:hypothetical protein
MTDFRELCAELLQGLDENRHPEVRYPGHLRIVMARARAALLAQPEPQGPTDEEPTDQEIEEWADAAAEVPLEEMDPEVHGWRRCFKSDEFSETIRAALARWGRSAAQPVAQGPTDEELMALAVAVFEDPFSTDKDYARAVLARWGRPAIEPVP